MNIPRFETAAFPNHSGTLLNIRHAKIVLTASYNACLTGFLEFRRFDCHNCTFWKSRGKNEKDTLKSHLKLLQLEIWHYHCSTVLLWYKDRPNYKAWAFTVKRGANITKSQYLKFVLGWQLTKHFHQSWLTEIWAYFAE